MMRSDIGFTLIELAITLCIIAILMSAALPKLQDFHDRQQGRHGISGLHILLHGAREQAIYLGADITLCPDNGTATCSTNWNQPLMVFQDMNNNRRLDANELLIRIYPAAKPDEVRSFSGNIIKFDPRGFSGINTGSLGYCIGKSTIISATFIISRMGRIRRGTDLDQDGITETASGNNIECPAA